MNLSTMLLNSQSLSPLLLNPIALIKSDFFKLDLNLILTLIATIFLYFSKPKLILSIQHSFLREQLFYVLNMLQFYISQA